MKTIQRLYIYAVALVSLEVVIWGLIGLARSAFAGDEIGGDVTRLASALALIFVGIPVFLLHWWLAQKNARGDEDDRTSYVRAIFLYGALLFTLVPITQNILAIINRMFFSAIDLSGNRAMFGYDQTLSDLEKLLTYNDTFGRAYYLRARLRGQPGESREQALKDAEKAVELLTDDPTALADALILRGTLSTDNERRLADELCSIRQ